MNTMNNSHDSKRLVAAAAVFGAAGVSLGAFGAHLLKDALLASGHLDVWQTAVLYHLVHAVAALGYGMNARSRSEAPGWLWLAGCLLFSGSLYCLALGGPRWLGPVTPLGGILFIAGWLWAAFSALGKQRGDP